MIPKQLTLQNFLSYRQVELDFDGLHVACVCGPNGAGKSSLLEAIAWCVWGQSRVSTEDDVIRQGALEAQVSFTFIHGGQHYRIIRTRRRNQASALEFQIQREFCGNLDSGTARKANETTFKSITQKGVRATQRHILQQLKIDYETFVNSAYLRQGRADEFMLKRPSERKQVLADLLRLDHYDRLSEQAKESARTYQCQLQPIESLLVRLNAQAESQQVIQQDYEQLQAQIDKQKVTQRKQKKRLKTLRKKQQQRTDLLQQIELGLQQQRHQQAAIATSQAALAELQAQDQQIQDILACEAEITQRHHQLKSIQEREAQQADRFQDYQQAQAQRLLYQQKIQQQQQQQQIQLAQLETQLAQITQQEQALLKNP